MNPVAGPIAVVGLGAVGSRTARQLQPDVAEVLVHDIDAERAGRTSGRSVSLAEAAGAPVVVVATPAPQAPLVADLLEQGCSVVATGDDLADVREMLELHHRCSVLGTRLVLGAGISPGLSGLLARHLASSLDQVDEVHVAVHGTGGPACAHQHHRALGGRAVAWHDGEWLHRPGGSGRELCWFPEPIGARDCYRAEMADPVLLQRVMPELVRVSGRMSATRRDRLTARLPMLSPPHSEGGIGAVRVEVRGRRGVERQTVVAGTSERAAIVAGAVSASFAHLLASTDGQHEPLPEGVLVPGAAELPTAVLLRDIGRRGIALQEFVGAEELTDW